MRVTERVRCPACQAVNAAGRKKCDLCSALLRPSTLPQSSTSGVYCKNCHATLPESGGVCGKCGCVAMMTEARPLLAPASDASGTTSSKISLVDAGGFAASATPPTGWAVVRQQGGQVVLRRTVWGKFTRDAAMPVVLIVFGLILASLLSPRRGTSLLDSGPRTPLFVAFVGIGIVTAIVWLFLREEELTIGPSFLERRHWLLGQVRCDTLKGAGYLSVSTVKLGVRERGGLDVVRTLYATGDGERIPLAQVTEHHGRDSISDSIGSDGISQTSDYIAALTGWETVDREA
ncbi:MAG: zinc ribbon domain-containing protein [Akkermansiaceae bacterium]|nr:zinc ribbon domain-containing protein [Armatimonadota bacterium]